MDYSSHRRPRSSRLAPYRHALDHIQAFLDATADEDEQAKMKRAMVLMFGPPPEAWDEHGTPLWGGDINPEEACPEDQDGKPASIPYTWNH